MCELLVAQVLPALVSTSKVALKTPPQRNVGWTQFFLSEKKQML